MEVERSHQRAIVRRFAPHLSDAALTAQERVLFWLCLARVTLALALPACALSYRRDAALETPVLAIASVVIAVEIVRAVVSSLWHKLVGCCFIRGWWC